MNSLYARATVNLEDGIIEAKNKISKKMEGKARGPYDHSATTKQEDEVEFVEGKVFKEKLVTFCGEEFLEILCGGRIPAAYRELYLYVCTGQAPAEWVCCLDDCKLSASQRAAASIARN